MTPPGKRVSSCPMLQAMMMLAGLGLLGMGLARTAHPAARRAGWVLLALTVAAGLLLFGYGLFAYLSITPGD